MYSSTRSVNTKPACVAISKEKFSITSDEILGLVAAGHEYARRPEVMENIARYAESRLAVEYNLIQSIGTCGLSKITALSDRLGGLKAERLEELLQKQIQNPAVLHAIMCVTDSVLYISPYDVGSTLMNDRIRSYFTKLRTIAPATSDDIVMTGTFDGVENMMVIRSARDSSRDALLHEGIVGIYGTNSLRDSVPNFAYIFGGFKCSPPLLEPGSKEVITWCLNSDNAVNYVLYENISPAVPISQYIKGCTVTEFLQMYMQVLYALRTAFQQIDFTHYDLNDDNVMVRDVVAPTPVGREVNPDVLIQSFQIPYVTSRGTEYLKTNKIACIINYSRAHFKLPPIYKVAHNSISPGENIGVSGLTEYSVYPQRSWIMHDLYKLLMFCGRGALQAGNNPVASEIAKIFKFFNSIETLQQAVDDQWVVRYSLPLTAETGVNFTIDKLDTYIREVCDCSFISKYLEGPSLTCTPSTCLSEDQAYSFLGVSLSDSIPTPTDIVTFYEIALRLYNSGRETDMYAMVQTFSYNDAMTKHLDSMKKLVSEMSQYLSAFRSVNLSRMSLEQLFSPATLEQVKDAYITGGQIVDRVQTLKYQYAVGVEVAKRYDDTKSLSFLNDLLDQYNRYIRPGLVFTQRVIVSNDEYLKSIVHTPQVQEEIAKGGTYTWYWVSRREYDSVFGPSFAEDIILPSSSSVVITPIPSSIT
jgi:hypothetical protein